MYENGMMTKLIKLEKFLDKFLNKHYFLCLNHDNSSKFIKRFAGIPMIINTKNVKFTKNVTANTDFFDKDSINFYFNFSSIMGEKDDIVIDTSKLFSEKQINVIVYLKNENEYDVRKEFTEWACQYFDTSKIKTYGAIDHTKPKLTVIK